MRKATSLFALPAVLCLMVLHAHRAHAMTIKVVPDASSSDGAGEVYSLLDALEMAEAGATIELEDGTYTDRIRSTRPGEEGNPITIKGSRQAVLKATNPCIEITHSWIELEGFTVDGLTGDNEDDIDSYENKCVIVDGMAESEDDALDGFVMDDMLVQNCGGECVRLKNFVVNAKITRNTIENCGVHDYKFGNALSDDEDADKNGEGIYIGTSINSWEELGEDYCNNNLIRGNDIQTNGNECVDVKEGSSGNMIEENRCFDQQDSESGCFSLRGDANTVRNNEATDCRGAGVRIGGGVEDDTQYMHGQMNNVYGNTFVRAVEAALTVRVMPQGDICGNSCEDCTRGIERSDDLDVGDIEDTWDALCDSPNPVPPTPSPMVDTPAPVVLTPSPETEAPVPVISTLSPVAETPEPTDSTLGPESETPSPETETASPVADTAAPTLRTPTPSPVDETASPVLDTPSPTFTTPSPAMETPSPVADTPSPTQQTPGPVDRPEGPRSDDDDDDDGNADDDDDSVDDDGDNYMSDDEDDSTIVYEDDYMSDDEDDYMSYGGDYY